MNDPAKLYNICIEFTKKSETEIIQTPLQFVATTIKNLLIFDMTLCAAFPGIIIPALTGLPNEHNIKERLTMTSVQATWLGTSLFKPNKI